MVFEILLNEFCGSINVICELLDEFGGPIIGICEFFNWLE